MDCNETRLRLDAYLDGELDPEHSAEIGGHLQTCPACAEAARSRTLLRELVREKLPQFEPPPHLAVRIRAQLRAAHERQPPRFFWPPPWRLATALAGICLALVGGYEWGGRHARAEQFGEEMVSSQVQALSDHHLTDLASSDRRTIKPWLAGKLDFSPPVPDLSGQNTPLLGARVERLGTETAAALVYQWRKHLITVFVWPAKSPLPFTEDARRGFTMCAWRQAGWNMAVISDISDEEMDGFVDRLQVAMR